MFHHVFRAVAAATLLALAAPAQVAPVNNTGCPNFAPPQWNGAPRLGTTLTFSYQRRPTPGGLAFLALGYSSGGGIDFNQPDTCVPGPCRLYVAPLAAGYLTVTDTFLANMPIPIPNDRALLFSTFAVQGGTYDTLGGACFTLSQAVSFAIQP